MEWFLHDRDLPHEGVDYCFSWLIFYLSILSFIRWGKDVITVRKSRGMENSK